MGYHKIDFTKAESETSEPATRTGRAFKKTCAALRQDFSAGTDRIADVWTNENPQEQAQRTKKLKAETWSMVKRITANAKQNWEGVTLHSALSDISFEIGRAAKKTRDAWRDILSDIK
ncbi:MAG: hypothetical protein HQL23_08035 [Candidatus Omnitrophica bacterium]|nr:hypothetical protein [Candidatus Omnitrophota bacterium]